MAPTITFYILHGTDEMRREQEVNKLRALMGGTPDGEMNISTFDGEVASPDEVLNAVASYPFLADKRLVIVKDLIAVLTRKGAGETGKRGVELLSRELPALPDWSRLVLVERVELSASNPLIKLARDSANGYEKAFTVPKDTSNWIMARAREAYEAEIDPRAAHALATVTGADLRAAENEIIKLVSYTGGERPITEADVALLTPYVAEANIFNMVDAIASGQGEAALRLMHQIIDANPRDGAFGLYGMIIRQFRLLLIAKEHLMLSNNRAGLAEALGTKSSFVVDKTADQSRRFTLEQLEAIYHMLAETDLKIKTGRIDPVLALDLLVAGIAR